MKKLLILSILIWSSLLLMTWCQKKSVAETWDKVFVNYSSQNEIWEFIEQDKKTSFILWAWETFPIFDEKIVWMKELEEKEFYSEVESWYWIYNANNKIQNINKTVFESAWKEIKIWDIIELWWTKWLIIDTWEINIKIDLNEQHTREWCSFKVKLLKIEK